MTQSIEASSGEPQQYLGCLQEVAFVGEGGGDKASTIKVHHLNTTGSQID